MLTTRDMLNVDLMFRMMRIQEANVELQHSYNSKKGSTVWLQRCRKDLKRVCTYIHSQVAS